MTEPRTLGAVLADSQRVLRQYQENIRQRLRLRQNPSTLTPSVERRISALLRRFDTLLEPLRGRARLPHGAGNIARGELRMWEQHRNNIQAQFLGLARYASESAGVPFVEPVGLGSRLRESLRKNLAKAIDELPERGVRELDKQLERGIRRAVDKLLPDDLVQADQRGDFEVAKRETARVIFQQVKDLPLVGDTFKVVEGILRRVGVFFERRLPILRANIELHDRIERAGRVDARALDANVRARGQAWQGASEQVERSLGNLRAEDRIRVDFKFSIKPKLVLDPSRYFLDKISAKAGIIVKNRSFRFTFEVKIEIDNPLPFNDSTHIEVNPRATLNLPHNLDIRAELNSSWNRRDRWERPRLDTSLGWTSDNGRLRIGGGFSTDGREHRGTFSLSFSW